MMYRGARMAFAAYRSRAIAASLCHARSGAREIMPYLSPQHPRACHDAKRCAHYDLFVYAALPRAIPRC